MGKRYLERHIVTGGDAGFVTSGTPLYSIITKGNRAYKSFNVAPKQPVMWLDTTDGTIPTTIESGDITTLNVNRLRIGVGYDPEGQGFASDIRLIGADIIEGCQIKSLSAAAPKCSVAEIKAIYPGCISCDEFTVQVTVDDNDTRGWGQVFATKEKFVGTYVPDCSTCLDCPVTATCDEYICGVIDDLNNDLDLQLNDMLFPDWNGYGVERPYRAVKLHSNWNAYCISPDVEASGCEDCYRFDDLTTFTVDSVVHNFTGVVDPSDATKTLVSQLEHAAMQIEAKLQEVLGKHAGFAYVSRGIGGCCPIQLHVVTCDDTFAIAGLTPCDPGITQFPEFTENGVCQECGTAPTATTPTCGLAVIAKQDPYECDCYLELPAAYTGRHITVDVLGNSATAKYTKRAELQEGVLPAQYGSEVQLFEYEQIAGGSGRTYSNTNTYQGKLGLPDSTSKIRKAITADCNTSYCRYDIDIASPGRTLAGGSPIIHDIENTIWVPENDTTTKAEVEATLAAIVGAKPTGCTTLVAPTC